MKFSDTTPNPDDVIVGVDEAGRGPVLGPMILASVKVRWKDMHRLVEIGARDSKVLTESQRKRLYGEVKSIVEDWSVIIVQPSEIDTCPLGLNVLEMEHVAEFARKFQPDYIVVDSPYAPGADFNFKRFLFEHQVNVSSMQCFAENKADAIYPVVSAASIIAKEARERAMGIIRDKYQIDCGSGYPADPKTKKFLFENWQDVRYTTLIRKSWETYKRLAK